MDLDARDKKLVCLLDQDARRPLSHLSKELKISKQAVRQRILRMRAAGIISPPYAIVNTLAFGKIWAQLWVRLYAGGAEIEREMAEFAKRQKGAASLTTLAGAYDLLLTFWPETLGGFRKLSDEFLFRFSERIKEHAVSFVTARHDFSCRVFEPGVESVESAISEREMVKLDETDRKILNALAANADLSAGEIGKATGIEPKTVYYRIKKLEEEGLILNYRLRINYRELGHGQYKFFLVFNKLNERKTAKIFAFLKGLLELVYISEVVGPADLEFEVVVPSTKRLHEIINELRGAFPDLIMDYKYAEIRETKTFWRLAE